MCYAFPEYDGSFGRSSCCNEIIGKVFLGSFLGISLFLPDLVGGIAFQMCEDFVGILLCAYFRYDGGIFKLMKYLTMEVFLLQLGIFPE